MNKNIKDLIAAESINTDLYFIAILDGAKCKTIKAFLKEIGKAFKFPPYYGQNLNALNDCLNDLEWIDKPNYLLIIERSNSFLKNENQETRDHIYSFLERVSQQWANVPNYEGEEIYRHKADFKIKLVKD